MLLLLKVSRIEIFQDLCNTLLGRLWHHLRPKKAMKLIWLILHKGLPVGTQLVQMGLDGMCKVCEIDWYT